MYMKSIKIKVINHLEYCHQVIHFLYITLAVSFKLNVKNHPFFSYMISWSTFLIVKNQKS